MLGRPAATSPSSVPTSSIFEDDDNPRDAAHTLNEPSTSWKFFFVQGIKLNKISDAILSKICQPWQNAAPGQTVTHLNGWLNINVTRGRDLMHCSDVP